MDKTMFVRFSTDFIINETVKSDFLQAIGHPNFKYRSQEKSAVTLPRLSRFVA